MTTKMKAFTNYQNVDGETSKVSRGSTHSGSFISVNSKRKLNHFTVIIDKFVTDSVYYHDTDATNFQKKLWGERNQTSIVGDDLG